MSKKELVVDEGPIYLAAPFFNQEQINCVSYIERLLDQRTIPYISPRQQPANKGKITQAKADEIYDRNVQDVSKSRLVLCVLDFLLPEGWETRVTVRSAKVYEQEHYPFSEIIEVRSPALKIPDSGVMFEMGLAQGMNVHRVGFTLRDETESLNVMVAKGCDKGIIYGYQDLDKFLTKRELDWTVPKPWHGRFQ